MKKGNAESCRDEFHTIKGSAIPMGEPVRNYYQQRGKKADDCSL